MSFDFSKIAFSNFHHNGSKHKDMNPKNWRNWKKPNLPDINVDINGNSLKADNVLLRKPGVTLALTPEHLYEYLRCSLSPHYFALNYCKVGSHLGFVYPETREYQIRLLDHIHDERFSVAMMGRQCGKTVTVGTYATWYVTFHNDKTVLILANKRETALEHLKMRIQPMLSNLPKWMQQGVESFAKLKVELENGSRIIVSSTSNTSGAGMTINLLYLDEFALVDQHKAQDFITSVMPTISSMPDSKIIITSTPRGMNHFFKIYKSDNEFIAFGPDQTNPAKRMDWQEVPRSDINKLTGKIEIFTPEAFKEQQIRNIGITKWNQEYECKFLGSTNTLISGQVLENLTALDPIESRYNDTWRIYEKPLNKHVYIVGVDVSYGLGQDYHGVSIIDVTAFPYKVVCTLRDNITSDKLLSRILNEIGLYYNTAMMIIENNGNGARVALDLWELEYDNIFTWDPQKKMLQKGIKTTRGLKIAAAQTLKELLENNKLIIHCSWIIDELYKFISKGDAWAADEGSNDDMVMSCMLCAFFISLPEFEDFLKSPMNYNRDVLGASIDKLDTEVTALFANINNSTRDILNLWNKVSYQRNAGWL